ncbi:uncharacterized protein LOC106180028 [Lingula anatina]|uniref:Uncharacterized protein LOC106180028 n=2 Tax=Lingula anatina TaxID=7574 RepID=A0A1S3KA65_LINAN|nr:uncharacterized protein LOC106180028 [Lingula anatina]|eukprot:XP_013419344.1 uncharacterized protein LOC106180028 [Lingula anatina]
MKLLWPLFCLSISWSVCRGQTPDTSVCDPNANTGPPSPPIPDLPDSWHVRVECNFVDKNRTVEVEEYYDNTGNRGKITEYEIGIGVEAIYSYATNELILVVPQTEVGNSGPGRNCQIQPISSSDNNFLFGYNGGHIFSTKSVLTFGGGKNAQYLGKDKVRGIIVNTWQGCVYLQQQQMTANVTWYFTDKSSWTMAIGAEELPVRITTKGTVVKNGQSVPFDHIYDFVNFQPAGVFPFGDEVFQTPPGVVCAGRKGTKPLPKMPSFFSFTVEAIQKNSQTYSYIKEYYDYNAQIVRYDYRDLPVGDMDGGNPLSEIHDFNTGVRYIKDLFQGSCSLDILDPSGFDAKSAGPSTVRIRSPSEFFGFSDPKSNFTYTGKRKVRDIDADVWIGVRQDWPTGLNFTSYWEWSFAQTNWTQYSGKLAEGGEPIRMEVNILEDPSTSIIYNILDFNEEEPSLLLFDVGVCYTGLKHARIQFAFPGSYYDLVQKSNLANFQYAVMVSLIGTATVSPLRIDNLQVDFDGENIMVTFRMLDKAPIKGDVVMKVQEVDLDVAVSLLTTAISKGTFTVLIDTDTLGNSRLIAPIISSLKVSWVNLGPDLKPPAGGDTTVCDASAVNANAGPPLPTLPNRFSTTVQCNFLNRNKTIDVVEYYDFDANKGVMYEYSFDDKLQAIFSYDTNELIVALERDGICTVQALNTSQELFIFGYNKTGGSHAHILSVTSVLRFGGNNKVEYLGKTTVRGILVDHWYSCIYFPELRGTMRVDWYFSDPNVWNMPLQGKSLPVRLYVKGKVFDQNGVPREFQHIYDFVKFQPNDPFSNEVFLTPPGMVCPGRVNTRPLPTPPDYFQFSIEIISPIAKTFTYQKEWYDFRSNLVRYDYRPLSLDLIQQFGFNPLSEVHDFNTGVRYVIDTFQGNCSYFPLQTVGLDITKVSPTEVRIRTPQEFFNYNNVSVPYTYTGVRKVRDIPADVWIAQRKGYPGICDDCTTVWEWYFAVSNWTQYSGMVREGGEPIRLEVTIKQNQFKPDTDVHLIYNVMDFDESEPQLWTFDIGACYETLSKVYFKIEFPGDYKTLVYGSNLINFKYALLLTIQGFAVVSPLRINNLEVHYNYKTIVATFTLLDKAPIKGDVKMSVDEVDLDVAVQNIVQAVAKGQFFVPVDIDTVANSFNLFALQDKLVVIPRYAKGSKPSTAGPDLSVCDPSKIYNTPGPSLPVLPDKFYTSVQCNLFNKNKTVEVDVWYDFQGNRAAMAEYEYDDKLLLIYNYADDEIIEIITKEDNLCSVEKISTSQSRLLFGYNTTSGKAHINNPYAVFAFGGDMQEMYMGKTVVRGMKTDHWHGCTYNPYSKYTLSVDAYFSDIANWQTPLGPAVPVRLYMQGSDQSGPTPRYFEHTYDFSNFKPATDFPFGDEPFQVPKGTICPGRVNNKQFPPLPNYFSFTSEVVAPESNTTSFLYQAYDYGARLVRYDYRALPGDGNPFGNNPLSEVHDFNTGVRYITDTIKGNCSVRPISSTSFDSVNASASTVRLRTALEFFDYDKNVITYNYQGKRKVRNMVVDVYAAKRTNWPPICPDCTSIWEWSFQSPEWTQYSGRLDEGGEPVMIEIKLPELNLHYIYNIINFNEDEPSLMEFDISQCYSTRRRHFQFELPGEGKPLVEAVGIKVFKYAVMLGVAGQCGISSIRVTNIVVDYDTKEGVLVYFTMLDKAPITGDVPVKKPEVDLDVAAEIFTLAINRGNFSILLLNSTNAFSLYAKPYSIKENERAATASPVVQQGLTTGQATGLAIGLFVLGIFLTLAVVVLVFKMRSGSGMFSPQRLDEVELHPSN